MSDLAIGSSGGEGGAGPFRGATVALMLAIGILGFVGMLVLGAYAPDLRSGRNGGAHALSAAATGYSGLVTLAAATGRNPRVVRNDHLLKGRDLLVLTPESGAIDIGGILAGRTSEPTLVVLPKWSVEPDKGHRGWVRENGLLSRFEPEGVLAPDYPFRVRRQRSGGRPLVTAPDLPRSISFAAPRPLQVIAGYRPPEKGAAPRRLHPVTPLVTDGRGGIVVAQLGGGPLYVLADPDLLANRGMKDARTAAAALALLDWMDATGATGIDFDVTLNGFGHSASPLRLAFDPPFLAMTLTLAAAALLAGLYALGRFGPVARRERAIAFGKAALVENAAALVAKARREGALGPRYAALVRERAAAAFGAPARPRGPTLDAYLDGLGNRARFTTLVADAEAAGDRASLLAAARALHDWQGEGRT